MTNFPLRGVLRSRNAPSFTSTLIAASVFAIAVSTVAADEPDINDILATRITFEWDNDSLQLGLLALARKVQADHPDFSIKIIGNDLQFEGITKNQRIRGLKLEEKTVAEVLTAMVLKANPNRLVKDPSDPRLKLVWGVAAAPGEPKVQSVLITTRGGARKRGVKLPEIFHQQ